MTFLRKNSRLEGSRREKKPVVAQREKSAEKARRKFKLVKVKPVVERRSCLVLVEVIVGVGGRSGKQL